MAERNLMDLLLLLLGLLLLHYLTRARIYCQKKQCYSVAAMDQKDDI